ncbi:MAG: FAD-dependent oxidoreductase [Fidelibacterota bacterium]
MKRKQINTDFLIIGGGTGGVCAAIAAARKNINVILVEETDWLGGMLSAAGVSCIDGNYNMQSGLFGEFAERIFDHYGGREAVKTGWVSHINYEPSVANEIIHQMTEDLPSLTILRKHQLRQLEVADRRIKSVIIADTDGQETEISASVVMDATEYGDAGAAAGCQYNTGLSETGKDDNIQDITWVAILQEYTKGENHLLEKPKAYDPTEFLGCCREWSNDQYPSDLPAEKMLSYGKLANGKYMLNWPIRGNDYFTNVLEMTEKERQAEWQKAREYTLNMIYFIQNELGFKHIGLSKEFPGEQGLAMIPYNRESRRFQGYEKFDVHHILKPYDYDLYQHGIAVGDYPIDHHHSSNPKEIKEEFPPIPSFNVPYDVIVSQDIDNLLLGEKNISVSHVVNGATRLQPVVMQLGQAAGIAASLSVKNKKLLKELNIRDIQQHLIKSHGYLMPVFDLDRKAECFQQVHRVCAAGMMKVTGIPYKWANRGLFYPYKNVTFEAIEFLLSNYFKISDFDSAEFDKKQELTLAQIKTIARRYGIEGLSSIDSVDKKINRCKFAILLDERVKPFAEELYLKVLSNNKAN